MCIKRWKCKQDDYTKKHATKAKNIFCLAGGYLIFIILVILIFGCLISVEDKEGKIVEGYINRVYFSGVAYFTIGFGDLVPQTDYRMWVLVEGLFGLIANGLFLGWLIYYLQGAQCKVQFSKKIYIYMDRKNRFCAAIVIKNRGNLIADINRGVDILKKQENNSTERLASVYQQRNYLNNKAMLKMREDKYKKFFCILQRNLKEPAKSLTTRIFLSGQDAIRRSTVVAFEECELETMFVKSLSLEPQYSDNGQKLKDVRIKITELTPGELKTIKEEFLSREFRNSDKENRPIG